MLAFRVLLVLMIVSILAYTGITISNHGLDLFPIFFGDITEMAWPGQFNFDFLLMLVLSALWTAWRYKFSAAGLALGVCAFVGGIMFQSVHLLILTFRENGNAKAIMIGRDRL